MIPYRDPAPAYWAHVRAQERAKPQPVPSLASARYLAKNADLETLAKFDLRPTDEILSEITARHPDIGITAAAAAALEAYPITAEALAEDADQETARLVLLKAISHRREAPARARRAKVKAKMAAKRRAKEDADKRWLKQDRALAAQNPRLHSFLERHGLRGRRG